MTAGIQGGQREERVDIIVGQTILQGSLVIPERASGVVLFAHGSGSSRFSPRNRYVAVVLRENGLATLMIDLLTRDEEQVDNRTRELRFDIRLLAHRVIGSVDWLTQNADTRRLRIGLFGASTGAAAALVAAASRAEDVSAVVSRGGRPDLAGSALGKVKAPTLFIVGELDTQVITLNRQAAAQVQAENKIEIVPRATHLFEEPGTLEHVARLAGQWFARYLSEPDSRNKVY